MGGLTPNPTYEETCTGLTGHAEAVLVAYDPEQTTPELLLKEFWENHDPTQGNRQGNDIGTAYRSAIYWTTPDQQRAAEATREAFQKVLTDNGFGTITTELRSAEDAGTVLLRRGLPPAVPLQEPRRLLQPRPQRHDLPGGDREAGPAALAGERAARQRLERPRRLTPRGQGRRVLIATPSRRTCLAFAADLPRDRSTPARPTPIPEELTDAQMRDLWFESPPGRTRGRRRRRRHALGQREDGSDPAGPRRPRRHRQLHGGGGAPRGKGVGSRPRRGHGRVAPGEGYAAIQFNAVVRDEHCGRAALAGPRVQDPARPSQRAFESRTPRPGRAPRDAAGRSVRSSRDAGACLRRGRPGGHLAARATAPPCRRRPPVAPRSGSSPRRRAGAGRSSPGGCSPSSTARTLASVRRSSSDPGKVAASLRSASGGDSAPDRSRCSRSARPLTHQSGSSRSGSPRLRNGLPVPGRLSNSPRSCASRMARSHRRFPVLHGANLTRARCGMPRGPATRHNCGPGRTS